ncbi:hypothetical protein BDY21DRAFT_204088 [Lineolata rhizophorae]|uniref:Heme peroxidase n=1 Tax=Lineolata rhizophorae TaxID=578093 RepID=A0A6A6P5T9_9PEZI|nr:hypothetical protein BDY21DRAFT_204088 [Lineolata rhizophorae]
MPKFSISSLAWLAATAPLAAVAAPTWPSPVVDEIEDIMFLTDGYRARGFAEAVTPCDFSAQGPGRVAAAEWIRTAFHDMATGNVIQGTGGLDASLMFEMGGDNIGAAFATTLETFTPFLTSRSSMADLIATGMYTAVRSCGGPVVRIRAGRQDATTAGGTGVPLPQNSLFTFQNQFARMGFDTSEMIAVTACGHTLGGVHSENFPDIVPPGTAEDEFKHFDSTQVFDNRIATEFLDGSSTDPLVVGPSRNIGHDSDRRVFQADSNATIAAMTDPEVFASTCSTVLQKMIEVVPTGTIFSDPIEPYEVKPYGLQLSLLDGGTDLSFTGEIRIRTTERQIAAVQLVYKDREGGDGCGDCTIDTQSVGTASGFDDEFSFFGFSSEMSTGSSISSFSVRVTLVGGSTELHDNNGSGFPVQDAVMLQKEQSCLDPTPDSEGKQTLTIVAAVRDGEAAPTLILTLKGPRPSTTVPELQTSTVPMVEETAIGLYSLYSATYPLDSTQVENTKFDISVGSGTEAIIDGFKDASTLPTACSTLSSDPPTSTPQPSGYSFNGCYTDSNTAQRALSGATHVDDAMDTALCADLCDGFKLFGTEYGVECYCGNELDEDSSLAALSDCSMACGGNAEEMCGAGYRLSVYENSDYEPVGHGDVAGYEYEGCFEDSVDDRVLNGGFMASDDLTAESCADYCGDAAYFGMEYGRECYCGQTLGETEEKPESDCSFLCAGDSTQYCGAGNRINIYAMGSSESASTSSAAISSSTSNAPVSYVSSSTVVTSSSSSFVVPTSSISSSSTFITMTSTTTTESPSPTTSGPSVSGWAYQGCYTDSVGARVLTSKSTTSGSMTYEMCSSFCGGNVYFGVEYAGECYCGDRFTGSTEEADESDCNMACSGDANANCGGPNRLTLFKSTSNEEPPAGPANAEIPGYSYVGCKTDSVGARVLDAMTLFDAQLTVEMCADFCDGSTYFGTEYGQECYCGDGFSNPTSDAPETDCSFACAGDEQQLCGAGNRLSLYEKVS